MKAVVNARLVLPERMIEDGIVLFDGGRILFAGPKLGYPIPEKTEIIDARGNIVGPGFVDIHCHGGDHIWVHEDPERVARWHLGFGTTSLLGTIYRSVSRDDTVKGIRKIKALMREHRPGNLAGVHLEGPYLNPKYGAGAGTYRKLDADEYRGYIAEAEGIIRNWTFAPEVEGIGDFVSCAFSHGVPLAIGHSEASYEQVERVADKVRICTHLMDATGVCSETPAYGGTKDVTFDDAAMLMDHIYCEVICDSLGAHVRPEKIRLIIKTVGIDRIVLVTDHYVLDNPQPEGAPKDVNLIGKDLYGSTLTMDMVCKNLVKHTGLGPVELFKMVAKNPAEAACLYDVGTIESGKRANMVILTPDYELDQVILDGEIQ